MSINYNLERVFFHELGHFVAHEIIFRTYGIHDTEKIEINRHGNDYGGVLVPIVPEGQDPATPLENKSEKIAELVYGCFFQALHLDTEFKDCFTYGSQGHDDANEWAGILGKLGHSKHLQISELKNIYFKNIKENGELKSLFEIKPKDYLIDISERTSIVNLKKLKEDIEPYLKHHIKSFIDFVEEIRSIIEKPC